MSGGCEQGETGGSVANFPVGKIEFKIESHSLVKPVQPSERVNWLTFFGEAVNGHLLGFLKTDLHFAMLLTKWCDLICYKRLGDRMDLNFRETTSGGGRICQRKKRENLILS